MSSNRKNNTSFLVQGSILAGASIISRIIGLFYRMPLTAIIGDVGNDYYSCAYEIYSMMLLISSYSLPLAVSKMVSARVSVNQHKNAYRVFKGALLIALTTGTAGCLFVFFASGFLTEEVFKTPMSIFALQVLAPTLIIVAVLGVIRGFFQGLGTMVPSAVSQILEQIVNAGVSVGAAFILVGYGRRVGEVLGTPDLYGAAYGAAGGTLGTGIGAATGLLFLIFIFSIYRPIMVRRQRREWKQYHTKTESYRSIIGILLMTIIPVLLSTTIYNISSVIDQGVFKNIASIQGYDAHTVSVWWGIFAGKYKVLINVPISIASAIAASCVPSLTAAFSSRDKKAVKSRINLSMRFVMIIAFPCTAGFLVLASPILQLLFHENGALAAHLLQIGSVSIIFYSISTLSNGILQGINRMRIPVRNAVIALAAHIICLCILMFVFHLNIYSVVLSTAFFALMMCILNGRSVQRYSGYRPDIAKTYIKPALASVVMGVVIFIFYRVGYMILPVNAVWTVLGILIGMFVYAAVLLRIGGLTAEEMKKMPKGTILLKLARKFHMI